VACVVSLFHWNNLLFLIIFRRIQFGRRDLLNPLHQLSRRIQRHVSGKCGILVLLTRYRCWRTPPRAFENPAAPSHLSTSEHTFPAQKTGGTHAIEQHRILTTWLLMSCGSAQVVLLMNGVGSHVCCRYRPKSTIHGYFKLGQMNHLSRCVPTAATLPSCRVGAQGDRPPPPSLSVDRERKIGNGTWLGVDNSTTGRDSDPRLDWCAHRHHRLMFSTVRLEIHLLG
jgi:hypothetical protein